jgi:hypothetical protein
MEIFPIFFHFSISVIPLCGVEPGYDTVGETFLNTLKSLKLRHPLSKLIEFCKLDTARIGVPDMKQCFANSIEVRV